jgi:putative ABC transport system permease protein
MITGMFNYYLSLALGSLRRNAMLTGLMIIAIGVGIGASMTTLAVFRAMSGDPIPRKSSQLFVVQIDNWGPNKPGEQTEDQLKDNLSYIDAMALMHAHAAKRQTAIYSTYLKGRAPDTAAAPFQIIVPAVYADFFPMFDAPFQFGGPWTQSDDAAGAPVAVIPRKLNDKLFNGANSVGKTLLLNGASYRVIGVLDRWPLVPRFYNLHIGAYADVDELFIPFTRAISIHAPTMSGIGCQTTLILAIEELIHSECVWIQFWAELPTRAHANNYRAFLDNYAADQQNAGRFHWPPHTQMRNVRQWLKYQHILPGELSILVLASFGFLFVCLMNAMGLMLAKIMARTRDIGVRRALGASRRAIAAQCLVESAVIGILGAVLGLVLTLLGALMMRAIFAEDYARLTYITVPTVALEVLLAIAATMAAALYPTWRAANVEPALQLKAE